MLKERLTELFRSCDPAIQEVISEVLMLEQAHITMERYQYKEQIDQIISRVAAREVERISKIGENPRGMFNEI
jgi:hypothetical protein